ncbi:MAG: hypothetical protein ACD_79C00963G0002 [uncultured bacterium]|nr:MAG: hypothetical protein ACD_79C00963G0002 [uncultured bacterium]
MQPMMSNIIDMGTVTQDKYLNKIREMTAKDSIDDNDLRKLNEDMQGLDKVARSFEGIFMKMLMKEMKSTVNSEDGIFPKSTEMEFFEDMLDEEYSKSLSEKGGLGIKEAIIRSYSKLVSTEPSKQKINIAG